MKKTLVIFFFCMLLSGCATVNNSSINAKMATSQNIPKRVGVFPFTGDLRFKELAADLFSIGLIEIPYFQEVVDRNKIAQILQELGFQHSGLVDERTRVEIGKQLGVDAIFTGDISAVKDFGYGDTRVVVKLIDVKTGVILWGCNANDPRTVVWHVDLAESVGFSIKNALKTLQEDLKKIKTKD